MEWSVTVSEEEKVVYAVFSGQFTPEHLPPVMSEALALGARHRVNRYLADVRATTVAISTTQIYLLPKMLEALGLERNTRVALVIPGDPARQEDFEFYQTVSRNQGFNVRLFREADTARQWLVRGG